MTDIKILFLPYNFFSWAVQRGFLPSSTMIFWDNYKEIELPREQVKFVLPADSDVVTSLNHLALLTAIYQGSQFNWPAEIVKRKAEELLEEFGKTLSEDTGNAFDKTIDPDITVFDYEKLGEPIYLANFVHPVLVGLFYLQKNGMLPDGRLFLYVGGDVAFPTGVKGDKNDWIVSGRTIQEQRLSFLEQTDGKIPKNCIDLLINLI